MAALLVAHHRPGFYFRVLQEGEVGAGDDIVKIADGPERISVAEVDALLYLPGHSREQLQRALRIPALSKGWQGSFQAILPQESAPKPQREIRDSQMRNKRRHGPVFDRCESRIFIRKAIA